MFDKKINSDIHIGLKNRPQITLKGKAQNSMNRKYTAIGWRTVVCSVNTPRAICLLICVTVNWVSLKIRNGEIDY